ncbi:MAG: hypothetical protein V2I56_03510 [Desulfobacteraceae bacterium]|jgi:hypothetical protein|nr:hypothetical protein [Desulfobacteraceae bacterium]
MATVNDLVLIYFEDQPLRFARIEEILPDSKPDWYHVKLLMLQIPPQYVTWILRDVYIGGAEFTMNEKRMRLEKVVVPEDPQLPDPDGAEKKEDKSKSDKKSGTAKVISLKDIKKQ